MVHFNNSSLVKANTKGQTTPSNSISVNIDQCRRSSNKPSDVDVKSVCKYADDGPLRPKHVVKYTRRIVIYKDCEEGK
jgi:hypothetical protein